MAKANGLGEMVVYKIGEQDVDAINRRREHYKASRGRGIEGFIAHVGNPVQAGDEFPMLITRVWGPDIEVAYVNGQVFLDGNDVFWATSVNHGFGEREFTFVGEEQTPVALPDQIPMPGAVTFVGEPGAAVVSAVVPTDAEVAKAPEPAPEPSPELGLSADPVTGG